MTYSYSIAETTTFTVTHAKHLASKVATDLKRMQRFYDAPDDERIASFEAELVLLLKHGYLETVTYGFRRGDSWIEPSVSYTAKQLQTVGANDDDDPGRVRPGSDVVGASFYSYLVRSQSWWQLSDSDRQNFNRLSPISRNAATTPGINGYLEYDRVYSAGGIVLQRASVRTAR